MKILIVDDDVELVGLLSFALETAGYQVAAAYDGVEALVAARTKDPALVILDVNLPRLDGFAVLAELRKFSQVPVLMLTVRATEEDEVQGLDLGADDYLRKPFSPRALLARVRSHLRRSGESDEAIVVHGPLALDTARGDVSVAEAPPHRLSPLEARLLRSLIAAKGRPVDADRLVQAVWLGRSTADRELLKQVVHRLRRKLSLAGGDGGWIEYVPGAGYAVAIADAA